MEFLLIILGSILLILGIWGAFLPALPGPPISFAGMLIFHFTHHFHFSNRALIVIGVSALIITILDYFLPIWGTKYVKGTKFGVSGATLGMLAGLFFPPLGIIIGPFLGALLAEIVNGTTHKKALMSALGSFIGLLAGVGFKFIFSIVVIIYILFQI